MSNTITISQLDQANQDFFKQQVSSGKPAISVVDEAFSALRRKQQRQEKIEHLQKLLMAGIRQAERGETIPYSRELIDRAFEQAQKNIKAGKPIRDEIKP